MRAKSIKNQARVNKELSLPELKIELKRTKEFVSRLEYEVGRWRMGEQVDRAEWASSTGSGSAPSNAPLATPTSLSRTSTPANAFIDGLKDGSSRPMTPGGGALDKDEREDFFRRENELNDQLAEKVCLHSVSLDVPATDILYFRRPAGSCVARSREDAATASRGAHAHPRTGVERLESESSSAVGLLHHLTTHSLPQELKAHSADLNELRLVKERLEYDNKESTIQIDTLREQIEENEREIEDLRKQMEAIKISAKDAAAEEKERRKAEKMAAMMAKFDAVSLLCSLALRSQLTLRFPAGGHFVREGGCHPRYSCKAPRCRS